MPAADAARAARPRAEAPAGAGEVPLASGTRGCGRPSLVSLAGHTDFAHDIRPGTVAGWGGGPGAPVSILYTRDAEDLQASLAQRDRHVAGATAIARGLGRSYGDAAQCRGGVVLDTSALKRSELDSQAGVVTAQGGVTLAELLRAAVPTGWILPVVPGTQHVTVGGAVASDIHGKNHGVDGTFGAHVEALGLLTAAGETLELAPGDGDELLQATLGGMGLTGVILWARIRLRAVAGPELSVDTDRVDSLDEAFSALRAPGGPHRVAWLDLLGPRPARGIVTRADHLGPGEQGPGEDPSAGRRATVGARMTVPRGWPGGLLRPSAVQAHNELRYRSSPRRRRGHTESFGAHMFPLDALSQWPRLYGPQGFVQYQFVVPFGQERAVESLILKLRGSEVPCYLAVLKDFGPANRGLLSFPIAGWTVALDLPRAAPGLDALLRQFDELVVAAGGRVYLSKDARLAPDMLAAMYPRLDEWRQTRDEVDPERLWDSDLARRTGLIER